MTDRFAGLGVFVIGWRRRRRTTKFFLAENRAHIVVSFGANLNIHFVSNRKIYSQSLKNGSAMFIGGKNLTTHSIRGESIPVKDGATTTVHWRGGEKQKNDYDLFLSKFSSSNTLPTSRELVDLLRWTRMSLWISAVALLRCWGLGGAVVGRKNTQEGDDVYWSLSHWLWRIILLSKSNLLFVSIIYFPKFRSALGRPSIYLLFWAPLRGSWLIWP